MSTGHASAPLSYNRAFAIGVGLNVAFVILEFAYGILAQSLALVADAGHNLSDVLSLLLAWGAFAIAKRAPSRRFTYGLRKATILAALLSSVLLLLALGAIAWEAIARFRDPHPVDGSAVLVVAGIGVVINGITAWLFFADRKRDLNIRGAFLHMTADAAVSVGVVLGALGILATGWLWIDPALSLGIVVVILLGTLGLLRDSLQLSLDAVPRSVDFDELESWLREQPEVADLHDLHVWAMSTTENALTAHLVTCEPVSDVFLRGLGEELEVRFGIQHTTVQVEQIACAGASKLPQLPRRAVEPRVERQ